MIEAHTIPGNEKQTARAIILISGKVQGVMFRESARQEALQHNILGFAENLADERVRLVAEGKRRQLDALIAWCHHGPPFASVESVAVQWQQPQALFHDFLIR